MEIRKTKEEIFIVLYKVKEIADMAGVSVRTLHHYDKIGLLKPNEVNESGYRFYTLESLEKLQQILFFKELDFNLHEIKEMIEKSDFDRKEALKDQKKLLEKKLERLKKIINTVDNTIKYIEVEIKMNEKEMFKGFNEEEIESFKEEVKNKYGSTEAYKESVKKTSKYSKKDWEEINADMNSIFSDIADNMDLGVESKEVQELIEKWRNHINKYHYNCTKEILGSLGQMYVYDERFKNNIDRIKEGLAEFLSKAIEFYCK